MPVSRSGCLFVHIPKCAGTSIEVALGVADKYPQIGLELTATSPHLPSLFGGGLQHLTLREIRRNFPEVTARPGLFSFSIVRDPVDRFVSQFLWKHQHFSDLRLDDETLMPALLADIDRLVELSRSLDLFRLPFEGHEYCEGDNQTLGVDDIRRHLLPQCSFLFDRGTVSIDAIYSIGAMDVVERDLQQHGALAGPIPQRMAGKASKSLRQMIPASAERAIQDVYCHDARLFAQVDKTPGLAGAAVDASAIADDAAQAPSSWPRNARRQRSFPRQLWMYWHQGWHHAPAMVKKCAECWITRNPSWQVNLLTAENLRQAIELPELYTSRLALPLPALSDVIRTHLLAKHGGVWVDGTTWCVRPLDEWLSKVLASTGFFAYALPAPDLPISTWFIAASRRHPLLQQLKASVDHHWQQVAEGTLALEVTDDPHSKDYFWIHRIFADLLQTDPAFADLWGGGPQISADAPHYFQHRDILTSPTPDIEFHIRNKVTNVYKLNRRIEMPKAIDGTVLGALFSTL